MQTYTEHTDQAAEETAAGFEKTGRRRGLIAATIAFALFAGIGGGYALDRGRPATEAEALVTTTEATTTTTTAELAEFDNGTPLSPAEADALGETDEQEAPAPEAEAPAAEEPPAEEPAAEEPPAPLPAQLVVPESVEVDGNGDGSFEISNPGDEDLDITSVTSAYPELTIEDVPATVHAGQSAVVGIDVDTSGYSAGAFELAFQVNSSAGSAVVAITGFKLGFVMVTPADLDVPGGVVVPHGAPVWPLKITNNEDYAVTITLESQHVRLTAPDEFLLQPGDNVVLLSIAPWAVNPASSMQMELEVSWLLGYADVTITKFGT